MREPAQMIRDSVAVEKPLPADAVQLATIGAVAEARVFDGGVC